MLFDCIIDGLVSKKLLKRWMFEVYSNDNNFGINKVRYL